MTMGSGIKFKKVKNTTNLLRLEFSYSLYSTLQIWKRLGSGEKAGGTTSPKIRLWVSLGYLLATRWRSFTSERSNQTWGQALTMALWMTPMRPPCTCPTCSQRKGKGSGPILIQSPQFPTSSPLHFAGNQRFLTVQKPLLVSEFKFSF